MQIAGKKILIVGCGYIGTALAEKLARNCEATAITLSGKHHERLRALGAHPIAADVQHKEWLEHLPDSPDVILNMISSGGREYRATYWQSNYDLLKRYAANPPKKFIYTSSTSV